MGPRGIFRGLRCQFFNFFALKKTKTRFIVQNQERRVDYRSGNEPERVDPQGFRFGNQNESARAFTRTHTLVVVTTTDHPLSPYANSA